MSFDGILKPSWSENSTTEQKPLPIYGTNSATNDSSWPIYTTLAQWAGMGFSSTYSLLLSLSGIVLYRSPVSYFRITNLKTFLVIIQ